MNGNYVSVIAHMRMCIVFGWFAMSRPSGMTNTAGTRNAFAVICLFFQNFQTSLCLDDLSLSFPITYGNTRGIISTIFQLGKTVQKDWCCLMVSCKTYYSTHKFSPLLSFIHGAAYSAKKSYNNTKNNFFVYDSTK